MTLSASAACMPKTGMRRSSSPPTCNCSNRCSANRPSACRKLHKLRDAVLLFDEAQSLPQHLAVPTLAALSHLSHAYNTSVVFATATQPAFDRLDEASVRKHAVSGWQPREIVPMHHRMFQQLERVEAVWPALDEALSWDGLSTTLRDEAAPQSLCVLNLKRHAHALLKPCKARKAFAIFPPICVRLTGAPCWTKCVCA
jgi:hypothetical protein